ncbi:MAG TPA: amidohydrolase family protein [Planctomycetota bacterium]|nr:amidohydrolase family protein [Planctomycetota bacterium]
MDAANIARSIILTFATGDDFAALVTKYGRYPDRFELWCYFDFSGWDQPGWSERAVAELERCHRLGARGVGELMDKGMGFKPMATKATVTQIADTTIGMHINDPRMKPLLAKCADLKMPINIHVAEDAWMYQKPDATNDGLLNAAKWNVDLTRQGIADHDQMITTLEEAVRDNPATTVIACHLANCCADLSRLARLFDAYPNLYADIGARYGELAPIPRTVRAFMEKYHTRLLYGTDNHYKAGLYPVSFRILETADEHFYEISRFGYHWPLYGLDLSDETLEALYRGNSGRVLGRP